MKAQCDKCNEISSMVPRKKRLRNKIDKHYYKCDHCKHIYVIGYMDEDIRKERKRLRKLIERNNPIYKDKIERKQSLIESKMNELKGRVEASA